MRERGREADRHAVDLHLLALGGLEMAVRARSHARTLAPAAAWWRSIARRGSFAQTLPPGVEGCVRPEVIRVEVAHGHVRGADRVGLDPEAGASQRLLLGRGGVEAVPARRQGHARIDEEPKRAGLHVGRHRPDAERVRRERHHAHDRASARAPVTVMPGRRRRCASDRSRSLPVTRQSSAGVIGKTACGVPAAAISRSYARRSRSMNTRSGRGWPTGGTPPIA